MTTTLLNPGWLDPAAYIAFLNRAFPGQWDRNAYDWYLARSFRGVPADILVRADGERLLAGMGMSHRQIGVGGRIVDVGVITAAATLPDQRGQGHYAKLLRMAVEYARDRRYVALLGFVTHDNGSGRGLMRLGSRAIPSFYVHSGHRPAARHPTTRCARDRAALRVRERVARELARSSKARQAHFHYERAEDWESQLIRRPHAVHAVQRGHDSLALVETVGSTDRLQWLACPKEKAVRNIATLAARSESAGKRFFMYTLDGCVAAAAGRAGLRIRSGYLMLQPTGTSSVDWNELAAAAWSVQSGDRL